MEENYLTPHNILIQKDMWTKIQIEAKERNMSASDLVRELISKYYSIENYQKEKHLASRFANSIEVFDILIVLTSQQEYKDKRVEEFWLSYNDILDLKFGRWSIAKQSISIFTKICRELKCPVEYEALLTRQIVEGTTSSKLIKEGFNLFFETPITHEQLRELRILAVELLQRDGFEEILILHPTGKTSVNRKEQSRDKLKQIMDRNRNGPSTEQVTEQVVMDSTQLEQEMDGDEGFDTNA